MTYGREGTEKRVQPVFWLLPHQIKNLVREDPDSHRHQISTAVRYMIKNPTKNSSSRKNRPCI